MQKRYTTSHLHTKLDHFVSKLTIFSLSHSHMQFMTSYTVPFNFLGGHFHLPYTLNETTKRIRLI